MITGYKLNNSKTFVMLLNQVDQEKPINLVSKFKVVDCFKYLGSEP